MTCPRCGRPLAPGAAFCMHCGQMVARPPSGSPAYAGAVATSAASGKKKLTLALVVVGLAMLALMGTLVATGTLRLGGSQRLDSGLQATGRESPPSLVATGEQSPSSLVATGTQPPPNLQASGAKKVMPDDVRRWLEHLERIEKRRVDMSYDQVARAMEMLVALQAGGTLEMLQSLANEASTGEESTEPKATDRTARSAEEIRGHWRQLLAHFNSYPPPAECVPIRDEYDVALRETGAMIGDILASIEQAEANRDAALSGLMKMRGKSVTIDRSATESDGLVQAICDKYETRKWFRITADIGGGALSRGGF